jgi:PAS domain S-box-containing protein
MPDPGQHAFPRVHSPVSAPAGPSPAGPDLDQMIRAHDWAATQLGPMTDWPASLRTAVDICVASRFPIVMYVGHEFRMLYNDAYVPLLGRKHPQMLGQPCSQAWAEVWPTVGPMLNGVLRTGVATFSEDLLLIVERAGYPEEAHFTFSLSPVKGHGSEAGSVFCACAETTARILAERRRITLHRMGMIPISEASTAEEACRAAMLVLADNPADVPFAMSYLLAPDGQQTTLVSSSGFPSERVLTVLAADAALNHEISVAVSTQSPRLLTGLRQRNGGMPRRWAGPVGDAAPDSILLLPLTVAGAGHATGVLCCGVSPYRELDDDYRAFFDLTARQLSMLVADARSWEAERIRTAQLAELDHAKTVFFSNISHEFRTPLTLMMGPLEELRADPPAGADPAALENLEVMHRNGLRLGKLVNTLLDFSRIQAGRMQASYEPVDLAAMTAELASVFRAAIEKAGLAFEVDCPALGEPVYVDRDMWEKVVLNLLSNALKYTFEGLIRISLWGEAGGQEKPGFAVLQVTDTGTGIPERDLPHLFERFYRVYQARSRSHEGSGIGLALVRELVGLHGGCIAAESAVDAGSTFTVRLPLGCGHLAAERLVRDPATRGWPVNADPYVLEALRWSAGADDRPPAAGTDLDAIRGRVLIADDNADMREYLSRLLSPGYNVRAVGNGTDALAAARAERPDLIISDVMMPEMDGMALVGALRGNPATAAIPVLLLTARAGQDATVEGLDAGADDYLAKPFSAQELLARVRSALEPTRLWLRESRFRQALVDSLGAGFFVVYEGGPKHGLIFDVNDVFGEITGYGPEGLPYTKPYPWEPDATEDPELRRLFDASAAATLRAEASRYTYPMRHRDGRLVWAAITAHAIPGFKSHGRILVGTVRDVTTEHEAARREAAVSRLTAGLTGAADTAEVLKAGLAELRRAFGARRVVAAVWSLHAGVSVIGVPEAADWPALDAAACRGLEAARAQPASNTAVDAVGAGQTVCVVARLEAGGDDVGIWLDLGTAGPLNPPDRELFGLLAAQLGHALARALHYEQARDFALALQHSVLGQLDLPAGFAVRYEPAMRPLEVGGDWYDVTPLDQGRLGVVVGDCVGRGLDAAVIMGQLRSACRALLLRADGPAQVLADLDTFAERTPAARCSTVFCAIIDPATATITYSSAGHPPAILADPKGAAPELLDQATSGPLAVLTGEARAEATALLRPGSALLLYTDGLIERRGERLDTGIRKAAELVQRHLDGTPDELADEVMAALAPAGGFDDDVAVLSYREPPAPLRLTLPAEPRCLAGMRRSLRHWLAASAVPSSAAAQIALAAGEACSNAIEHAYAGDPTGQVKVTAHIWGPRLELVVEDSATWKPSAPDRGDRGHGLVMMRTFMDEIAIESSPAGTTVRMTRDVRR